MIINKMDDWEVSIENVSRKDGAISNCSVQIRNTDRVAVMGLSGSGKTTILKTLSGRSNNPISGEIKLNGGSSATNIRHICPYIDGSAEFDSYSSVGSLVKFKEGISTGKVPMSFLSFLEGLGGCKLGKKGQASTGQQGILKIALELSTYHPFLFIDEVLNHLDESTLHEVLKTLSEVINKQESSTGIVATLHKPSLETLGFFNRLVVMHQGTIIYDGSADSLIIKRYHDDLIKESNGIILYPAQNEVESLMLTLGQIQSMEARLNDKDKCYGTVTGATFPVFRYAEDTNVKTPVFCDAASFDYGKKSFSTRFFYLYQRYLVMEMKRCLSWVDWLQQTVLFVVHILTIKDLLVGRDISNFYSQIGPFYSMNITVSFRGVFLGAYSEHPQRKIFSNEINNLNWYSKWEYALAKMLTIPVTSFFWSICYWLLNILIMDSSFVITWGFVMSFLGIYLASMNGYLMGWLACAITESQYRGISISVVINAIQSLHSGSFHQIGIIPVYLKWVTYLMYLYFTTAMTHIGLLGYGVPYTCNKANYCPSVFQLLEALGYSYNYSTYLAISVILLLVWVCAVMIVIGVGKQYRKTYFVGNSIKK